MARRHAARPQAHRIEPRTLAALAGTIVLWASAFAGIKAGLAAFQPGEVALLRFVTASAVLGVYAAMTRMRMPAVRDLPVIAAAGVVGITLYHVALNYGEKTVSAGAASLIISAVPIFTSLLAVLFLGERLRWIGWGGIVVSFLGVVLITFGQGKGIGFDPNAWLIVLAAFGSSVYFIMQKPLLRRYSALELTTFTIWAGTVPMLVFARGLMIKLPGAPLSATLAVVYLGIFPAAIAYFLWSWALARTPASITASFLYVSPVLAILIAAVWIHEVPTSLSLVGGVIALAGVIIVNTFGRAVLPQEVAEIVEDPGR